MESINRIAERLVPLFSGLRRSNNLGLRTVRPLVPNRIKFIYTPVTYQIIYPGIYFVIPNELMLSDMALLEASILKVLEEHPTDPEKHKLAIPIALARKLSGQAECSPLFNTFQFKHNKLYLRSVNCVWVNPNCPLAPTNINNPRYGEVHSLGATIKMLMNLSALLSLHLDVNYDNREIVARRDSEMIGALFPNIIEPTVEIGTLGDVSLHLGSISIWEFSGEEAVNIAQALLYSFLNVNTDLSDYMEWR